MGINIAICETECVNAPCREKKLHITRIMTHDKMVDLQASDDIVSVEDAKKAVGDWGAFLSRNRMSPDTTAVYMSKVKKEEDVAALKPYVKKVPNGWVILDDLSEADRKKALEIGDKNNFFTAWMEASFDECTGTCASCPLAWNKGRNCMETFGPDNSKLPEIAAKVGCKIVGNVPTLAKDMTKLTSEDAKELLKEIEILRPALVADGKMAVHRYSGVLDRLEAMAKACSEQNCGFYFF